MILRRFPGTAFSNDWGMTFGEWTERYALFLQYVSEVYKFPMLATALEQYNTSRKRISNQTRKETVGQQPLDTMKKYNRISSILD
ncbi:hypothetical protein CROQUDRAFT_671882 [Cronartium quercuum f. sp. fusiforme G11]|uniref:Uncharacterized protein n=1 Tax=Cronartium quercuum f. sp. fusiforme G11 TaxID=708437 RepID=A0A9P6NED2_9BASI|nr:hypothetical protein CROQUDRAFT_671882 [Cronartium quercuum f. sp. fusiforme G11]